MVETFRSLPLSVWTWVVPISICLTERPSMNLCLVISATSTARLMSLSSCLYYDLFCPLIEQCYTGQYIGHDILVAH